MVAYVYETRIIRFNHSGRPIVEIKCIETSAPYYNERTGYIWVYGFELDEHGWGTSYLYIYDNGGSLKRKLNKYSNVKVEGHHITEKRDTRLGGADKATFEEQPDDTIKLYTWVIDGA